jgi:ankyrin repeat protein
MVRDFLWHLVQHRVFRTQLSLRNGMRSSHVGKQVCLAGVVLSSFIMAPGSGDFSQQLSLLRAAREGLADIARNALDAGVSADARDENGMPALFVAAFHGQDAIVRVLLAAGAKPNVEAFERITPLMAAANRGYTLIVRELIQAGADVNAGDVSGTTALMYAVDAQSAETVEVLLTSGADVQARDTSGHTALDRCRRSSRSLSFGKMRSFYVTYASGRDDPVVKLLRDAGAR